MRVNSVFRGFYNSRLAIRARITLVALITFFIASSFTKPGDRALRVKEVNIIIRQIGHQLLLQTGDSTSRVLPVTETSEGTFLLKFENQLALNHSSLIALSEDLLPKTDFPAGYMVTVLDCVETNIVYGFSVSDTGPDKLPCRGRGEPTGCYMIEFTFTDFYEGVEPDKTAQPVQHKSVQADPSPTIKLMPGEAINKTESSIQKAESHQLTEELKPAKVVSQQTEPEPEKIKATTFERPLTNWVYAGMLMLVTVAFLIGRFGKISARVTMPDQGQAIVPVSVPISTKESLQELTAIGKFKFDKKGQRLFFGNEVTNLTDKECKILEMFNANFGELISRETLMQEVWINEGVITSRSLDMFVSKLRKKLSGDPELRITNVHGKGYKLESA